jgi:hypothetical protein
MKTYGYSVTYEYDGEKMPNHVKGTVRATSAPTAAARAVRETKGKGKRADSIVIVLTMPEAEAEVSADEAIEAIE